MKIDVLKTDGSYTGRQVDLAESIFGIEPNSHAIYLSVKCTLLTRDKELISLKKEVK